MLDLTAIRTDPERVQTALAKRGTTVDLAALLDLDQRCAISAPPPNTCAPNAANSPSKSPAFGATALPARSCRPRPPPSATGSSRPRRCWKTWKPTEPR